VAGLLPSSQEPRGVRQGLLRSLVRQGSGGYSALQQEKQVAEFWVRLGNIRWAAAAPLPLLLHAVRLRQPCPHPTRPQLPL
jgi:hypothetical protein